MLLSILLIPWSVRCYQPEVITNAGSVLGFRIPTEKGGEADIFLGIPFAKPPLGDLRFEKPFPPDPWMTPFNATSWGKQCLPHTPMAITFESGEDCLKLNVIKPARKSVNGYPILVYVHGGGFHFGSARRTSYQGFADAFSTRDVIIVSIQYRLGVFGFLSDGNELPGNLGLWDMTQALKFVKENARAFDGVPEKITLWGHSAGAAAVGQLLLSPHSRDFAIGGIEMSGSPWCNWALGNQVVNNSLPLFQELGCIKGLKSCLKAKSIEEIYEAVHSIGYVTDNLLITKWGPRYDGQFFPRNIDSLAKEIQKPVIYGLSDNEAALFTIMNRSYLIQRLHAGKDLRSFGQKLFNKRIKELISKTANYGEDLPKILEKISKHYLHQEGDAKFLNGYTDFVSDILFNVPLVIGAETRRRAGWPTYFYKFEHVNDEVWKAFNVPKGVGGSAHINEFPYMYSLFGIVPFNFTSEDIAIKEKLRDSFATFAHNGISSWEGVRWKEAGDDGRYIRIKKVFEEDTGFFKDSVNFWQDLKKTGYDLIELTASPKTKEEL